MNESEITTATNCKNRKRNFQQIQFLSLRVTKLSRIVSEMGCGFRIRKSFLTLGEGGGRE